MYENNNQFPNDLNDGNNNSSLYHYDRSSYMDLYGDGSYSYSTGDSDSNSNSYSYNYNSTSSYDTSKGSDKEKKKNGGGFKKVLKFAGCGALFGVCAGAAMACVLYFSPVREEIENLKAVQEASAIKDSADKIEESRVVETSVSNSNASSATVTDVSAVVEEAMPSVVSITGMYKVENSYNDFFGSYFGYPSQEQEEEGSGSGIIVGKNDEELLIATNNHVVEDATSLAVQFIDGQTVNAQIKGTEYAVDLAVIAVPLSDIPETTFSQIKIAALGDSESLKVGEAAIAIGNALGYGQSVTTGVISAVDREYTQDNTTNYLIQTDAAINPGNSGGALLNIKGEVVGINSSKIAGDAVEGMGYAIPISTAKPIIEELMTKQTRTKVDENQKAFLGISGINVTEDVQQNYGLPEGIYIAQVYENTAAANAGLKKGDILVEFDGEKVETLEELTSLLEYYKKGTTVDVVIMQGSPDGYQQKTITVTLGGRTDS